MRVMVIGAGPSGIAAAIQLSRYNIPVLVFEARAIGGLLLNANWVENYPGFPHGIAGDTLCSLFRHHLEAAGVQVIHEEVLSLDHDGNVFSIVTHDNTYSAEIAVAASGTKPRLWPPHLIPEAAIDRVFYEVHSFSPRGTRIAIIGGSDAAFDYAMRLAEHNEVCVLSRSGWDRCIPVLRDRALGNPRIVAISGATLSSITVRLGGLALDVLTSSGCLRMDVDYLVFAIGRHPNLDYMADSLTARLPDLISSGRLHLVGDVANGYARQAGIAIGDGLRAAMIIARRIKEAMG